MDSFNIHNYFKRGKTVVLTLRHGDEEIRQWADKDVADLLKLMKAFHTEFQNPRRKKKEVWDDVANELYKSGYSWSSEDCRKKWSNMIRTFKGIEEQRNDPTYQTKRLKWPFYDSMLQLLTLENSDAFPEASTVVQLLNSDLSNSNRNPSTASYLRKTNSYKVVDNFAKFQHQVQVGENIQSTSQFLESHRERDDSINLVSDSDLLDMGVPLTSHHDPMASVVQTGGVSGMDSNIIFTQPSRYKTQPEVMVQSSSSSLRSSTNKASLLAVRAKKRLPLKRKRGWKDSKAEDSIDNILSKFIETTNRQNEQMLEKMTSFHDNALALMQERNGILRDIRDSLHSTEHNESLVDACHEALEDNEDPQNTLTLHVGPAFSINAPNELNSSSAQLNSTLVISNSTGTTTSALSTFQLEDGTVLSSIDGTQDKTVLSNLSSFAQLPDVSLLHPSLVSVVSQTGENSSDMTLTMQNASTLLSKSGPSK